MIRSDKILECETCNSAGYCTHLDRYMHRSFAALCKKDNRYKEYYENEQKPPNFPTTDNQVKNVVVDGYKFIKDKCRLTSKEHAQARFGVCLKCDYYFPPKENPQSNWGRCSKCGCYSKVKSKGRAWTCRLGYWLEIDLEFNNCEQMSS